MQFDLANPTTVRLLMQSAGLAARTSKGQHFLVDRSVLEKIVAAAQLEPYDRVLEIGPGLGVLTVELAGRAKKVLAVELDAHLADILQTVVTPYPNVSVAVGNILDWSSEQIAERLGGSFKIVANVPYLITNVLFRKFLTASPQPTELVWLIQKEVAERICAKPGQMSVLAVSVQLYGTPEYIATVGRGSFSPAPKVDSAIIRVSHLRPWSAVPGTDGLAEKKFWQVVKIGFSSPRKQLPNNLAAGLCREKSVISERLTELGIDPQARPQELAVDDWLGLAKNL